MIHLVKNKRIAVFGNSEKILTSNINFLDIQNDFDIIIRFNQGINIKNKETQGTKTDMLVLSGSKNNKFFKKHPIKNCENIFFYIIKDFNRKLYEYIPKSNNYKIYEIDTKIVSQIHKFIFKNYYASSGFALLWLLHHYRCKNVSIYGFDFKNSKSFYELDNSMGNHNFNLETYLINKLVKKNQWVFNDVNN